jgi:hypothetical protein
MNRRAVFSAVRQTMLAAMVAASGPAEFSTADGSAGWGIKHLRRER